MLTFAEIWEDNSGGIFLVSRDADGVAVAVIPDLEYARSGTGLKDIIGIVDGDWDYTDAVHWYDRTGNTVVGAGDATAEQAAADIAAHGGQMVARYDGRVLTVYLELMSTASRRYLLG